MMHTVLADHKISRALMFIAIALASSSCNAGARYPATDICYLLKNMDKFDGKTIELRSEVKFTMHGRHLFGSQCSELGSLGLSIDGEKYKDGKIINFVRRVMSQHGEADAILLGQFVHKSTENYSGDFVLEDVIEIKSGNGKWLGSPMKPGKPQARRKLNEQLTALDPTTS